MKLKFFTILSLLLSATLLKAQDSLMIRKIYDEALVSGQCYSNLHDLCKNIGARLSGSPNAQKAVEWSKKLMESYGFDHVFLQEVMVPHWVRGVKEAGTIIDGNNKISVPIAALGMSVSTPKEGITADVIEVHSLKELDTLGAKVIKGKIVFFNRPFDPRFIETIRAYGTAGDQRFAGPAAAAKYGAIGVIVRSLTESLDDFPHTGATLYTPGGLNIPAAAISTKGANQLSALLKEKKSSQIKFYFKQNCEMRPDTISYNVVGELKGSENPNKFITVGGHLDSWDLAEGAHDDGTGVTGSLEAVRVLKALGYQPKNTIRVVFFMNDSLGRFQLFRNFAESNLTVATVKFAHNAFGAFYVAGYYANGFFQLNIFKGMFNTLVYGERTMVVQSTQINKGGINAHVLQNVGKVKSRMAFADRSQDLPCRL